VTDEEAGAVTDFMASNALKFQSIIDMVLGVTVMGTVGTLIGQIMGGGIMPLAIGVGLIMGAVVGFLGGRRFLLSILVGTVLGGVLAWIVAGEERMSVGAGAGAAMGGFLGVQISMLLDMRAARKVTNEAADSSTEGIRPGNSSS
jgi:hypothetical protein